MLIKRLQGYLEKQSGYYYEYDAHSKPLGEGGMGVVYKGYKINESSCSRRVVAIKAMFDGLPTEVYERAEREASIRLRNDNLVEMMGFISEVEIDPYGMQKHRYYVISEYLNGIVLSDLLIGQIKDRDGIELPYAKKMYTAYLTEREQTSIDIIKSVLSGIMALHDKGYIHRDIDPTNIMVTENGAIKLIDFGIAKYVRSLGTADKSLTTTGKFIGKAEFAPPELVLGDVRNQGYPTDIYAIGILFYQLLVGKLPFTGSKYEVLQMQLKNRVPVRNIKNSTIAKIVKKATEKNKVDRYSTVAELRAEIDKISVSGSAFHRYIKIPAIILLSIAACATLFFGVYNILPNIDMEKGDKTDTTSAQTGAKSEIKTLQFQDFSKDYIAAQDKLNSKDKNVASEGLKLMINLADKDCLTASKELGLTYCTFDNVLPSEILERRQVLGLNADTSESLSIHYLENLKGSEYMSAEVLYVLGYTYWRQHEWEKGVETLSLALDAITNIKPTNHSADIEMMQKDIKKYLRLCKEQLK